MIELGKGLSYGAAEISEKKKRKWERMEESHSVKSFMFRKLERLMRRSILVSSCRCVGTISLEVASNCKKYY